MSKGARQETDKRRVALWLRVSTDEQTVENQRMQLNDLAGMKGWSVIKEYDLSGLSAWQNSLQGQVTRVITDSRRDRFDTLLVVSIDRLTRRGVGEMVGIIQRLSDAGIALVSLREHEVDMTSPWGELVVAIFAYVAAVESRQISERTKAGLARARAQGKKLGRPKGSKTRKKRG